MWLKWIMWFERILILGELESFIAGSIMQALKYDPSTWLRIQTVHGRVLTVLSLESHRSSNAHNMWAFLLTSCRPLHFKRKRLTTIYSCYGNYLCEHLLRSYHSYFDYLPRYEVKLSLPMVYAKFNSWGSWPVWLFVLKMACDFSEILIENIMFMAM